MARDWLLCHHSRDVPQICISIDYALITIERPIFTTGPTQPSRFGDLKNVAQRGLEPLIPNTGLITLDNDPGKRCEGRLHEGIEKIGETT